MYLFTPTLLLLHDNRYEKISWVNTLKDLIKTSKKLHESDDLGSTSSTCTGICGNKHDAYVVLEFRRRENHIIIKYTHSLSHLNDPLDHFSLNGELKSNKKKYAQVQSALCGL